MPTQHPERIGKYDIERVIGSGAMGVVYRASHPIMEIPVAIKTMTHLALEKEELRQRFFQEARAAGKLQHENIVRIYDADEEDGVPYIVMEFLDGTDLGALLKDETDPLPLRVRLEVAYQVSRALEHAHELGVVHRDIKPSNVCVLRDRRVKLVDFGIAKLDTSQMTAVGAMLGTPDYMSPEQIRGETADAKSDVFSLGVMLYELLGGSRPFSTGSPHGTWTKILSEPPPPLDQMVNGEPVPDSLDRLVTSCLEKEPTGRPATAEVSKALRDVLKSMTDPYFFQPLREEQVREKLKHARELLDAGKPRRAEAVLRRLHGVEGQFADDLASLKGRVDRVAEAAEAVERSRKALRALDFEAAEVAAREALAEAPEFETAIVLLDQAVRARTINVGVEKARAALDAGDHAAALAAADEVLEADPNHGFAAKLREQAAAALERQERVDEALRRGRQALEAGDLTAARAAADEVLQVAADHAGATGLVDEIDEAVAEREREEARRREEAARQEREEARRREEAARREREEETRRREEAARQEREEARRRQEETVRKGREAAIAADLEAARQAMEAQDWTMAAGLARQVLERDEGQADARELLAAANAEMTAQRQRKQEVAMLLERAVARVREEAPDEAREAVEQALALAPDNEAAAQLLAEIERQVGAPAADERPADPTETVMIPREPGDDTVEMERTIRMAGPEKPAGGTPEEPAQAAPGVADERAAGRRHREAGEPRRPAVRETRDPVEAPGRGAGRPGPAEAADGARDTVADPVADVLIGRRQPSLADRVKEQLATPAGKGVAAVAALLVLVLLWNLLPSGEGPAVVPSTGLLAVDAVPWATVVRIVDAGGEEHAVDGPATTPATFRLPEGRYTITLQGPEGAERTVEVDVTEAGIGSVRETFDAVDLDEYFRRAGWQDGR